MHLQNLPLHMGLILRFFWICLYGLPTNGPNILTEGRGDGRNHLRGEGELQDGVVGRRRGVGCRRRCFEEAAALSCSATTRSCVAPPSLAEDSVTVRSCSVPLSLARASATMRSFSVPPSLARASAT